MRLPFLLLAVLPFVAEGSDPDAKPASEKRFPVRFGGLVVGAGYSHSSGYPGYWPARYWGGWYGPGLWSYPYADFWWGSFFHPGFFSGFARGPNMGEVRIRKAHKDASVYLDGAYAGTAAKLKTIWLQPGAYHLQLRTSAASYEKRIYVLSGKRLELDPEFHPLPEKEREP